MMDHQLSYCVHGMWTGRGDKIDLKDAYCLILVHLEDYYLVGMDTHNYVDQTLPFGFRSAPQILIAAVDFDAWVLHRHASDALSG